MQVSLMDKLGQYAVFVAHAHVHSLAVAVAVLLATGGVSARGGAQCITQTFSANGTDLARPTLLHMMYLSIALSQVEYLIKGSACLGPAAHACACLA